MKAVKWTSRSRDFVAAAALSHQRPTIYIWTVCKRHIVTSCVVCVPHMKWIRQKGTEPWSGNGKTFKRPVGHWLLTFWPRNDARHIVTLGFFVYHIWNESVKKGWSHRADTTKPSNDPCDLDLCLFDPEMVCDTWPLHIHGASRVCAAYSPRAGCKQRDPLVYGGRMELLQSCAVPSVSVRQLLYTYVAMFMSMAWRLLW